MEGFWYVRHLGLYRGCTGRRPTWPFVACPLLCRTGAEEMTLHEETRKQNEAIDKIYDGLNELLDGAKVGTGCPCMGSTCGGRGTSVATLQTDIAALQL